MSRDDDVMTGNEQGSRGWTVPVRGKLPSSCRREEEEEEEEEEGKSLVVACEGYFGGRGGKIYQKGDGNA